MTTIVHMSGGNAIGLHRKNATSAASNAASGFTENIRADHIAPTDQNAGANQMTELNALIKDIPIPHSMRELPISDRGFPIPWFVYIDSSGKEDFRVIGPRKFDIAVMKRMCWICGSPLGTLFAFPAGPMCVINRTSSEPPAHLDCAQYAVRACPFLANPRMRRNDKEMPEGHVAPPGMILRNPGAIGIYVTRSYKPFRVDDSVLLQMGEPERVYWYAEGRTATRAEVDESIRTGLPALEAACEDGGHEALDALEEAIRIAQPLLPVA